MAVLISFLPPILLRWNLLCSCTDLLHCIRYDTTPLPVSTNNAESGTLTCKNTVHGDGRVDWHLDCDDLVNWSQTGVRVCYEVSLSYIVCSLYMCILKLHLLPLLLIHKSRLTSSILHPWLRMHKTNNAHHYITLNLEWFINCMAS